VGKKETKLVATFTLNRQ